MSFGRHPVFLLVFGVPKQERTSQAVIAGDVSYHSIVLPLTHSQCALS